MQPNKTKIALLLGAVCIGASGAANAATANFNITVNTIPDVTLSQVQALSYGTSMFVTAGGTCLMNAAQPGNATPTGLLMQYQTSTNPIAAGASFGLLSGSGCVNNAAISPNITPGIYKITGISGGSVRITISGVTGTDFNFSPNSGCIVNYDGTIADDSCTSFVPGVQTTRRLANGTENTATAPQGTPAVAGELVFIVGGTVTIGGTDLTANQAYTQNFPVTVIY